MVVFLPAIFLLVKINSPSEGFIFSQIRIGARRKPFKIFKFRSMSSLNPVEITWAGRLLRRLKVDELPQLINILKGEMSLIGPRPWVRTQIKAMLVNKRERELRSTWRPGLIPANVEKIPSRRGALDYDLPYTPTIKGDLIALSRTFRHFTGEESKVTHDYIMLNAKCSECVWDCNGPIIKHKCPHTIYKRCLSWGTIPPDIFDRPCCYCKKPCKKSSNLEACHNIFDPHDWILSHMKDQ